MNRPSSAQIDVPAKKLSHQRPMSDQINASYISPEAQVIDKWFEDLSYYERTLDEMAQAKLDDSFTEELKAVENWFRVLSDPERTACIYSLLKGTTPLQIRFFITVLQQMAAKDASLDPLSASIILTQGGRPNSVAPSNNDDISRRRSRNSGRLSSDYGVRVRSMLRKSTQDEYEDEPVSPTNLSHYPAPGLLHKEKDWNPRLSQRSSSLSMNIATETLKRTSISPPSQTALSSSTESGLPPKRSNGLDSINSNTRQVGKSLPRPRAANNEEDWEPARDKSKPADIIDTQLVRNIPTWFRSLRLHKYTTIFENDDWRDIIRMDEEMLLKKGVAALGARRKMLKVFESARLQLEREVRIF